MLGWLPPSLTRSVAEIRSAKLVEAARIDGDLLLHVAKDPRL